MASTLIEIVGNPVLRGVFKALLIILIATILNLSMRLYSRKMVHYLSSGQPSQHRRSIGTRVKITRTVISGLIYLIAIVMILYLIPGFKTFSLSLLAGAGILAIVIGFAAQKTLSNLISGISIAIYEPFRIGDKINVSGENGEVEDINLRQTTIKTWDNKRIIIPNSIIAEKEVINYSLKEEKMLFTLEAGISYDSNIDQAREIMIRLANEHPENLTFKEKDENNIMIKKEPYVRVVSLGESSVNLRLYFWVSDNSKGYRMRNEILEEIKKAFDKEGVGIPFPHRTIVYKKDLKKKKNNYYTKYPKK